MLAETSRPSWSTREPGSRREPRTEAVHRPLGATVPGSPHRDRVRKGPRVAPAAVIGPPGAKRAAEGRGLERESGERGAPVRAASEATIDEEAPEAYDEDAAEEVVGTTDGAKIGKRWRARGPRSWAKAEET